MLRFVLILVLSLILSRMFWQILNAFREGISGGQRSSRTPQRGTQMVRDPVCGTFLLPERAVTVSDGRTRVYFCSTACRDKFSAQSSTRDAARGRTA